MPTVWHGQVLARDNNGLRLDSGVWAEERTIEVTSEKPVQVEFYRSWTGRQRVTGPIDERRRALRSFSDNRSPCLGASTIWSSPSRRQPEVQPNGSFEVKFDAECVSLFFIDRDQQKVALPNGLPATLMSN